MNEDKYIPSSAITRRIERQPTEDAYVPGAALPRTGTTANLERKVGTEGASGFELVKSLGWNRYREQLASSKYSDILNASLAEAERLRTESGAVTPERRRDQAERNARRVADQVRHIDALRDELEALRNDGSADYFPAFENNKLSVVGKEASRRYEAAQSEGKPVTRLYIASPTGSSVEIFRSLFDLLKDGEAIKDINLSLYLESVDARQAGSNAQLEKPANTNNIIVYIPDGDPAVIEEVVAAISKSKALLADAWKLEAWEQADTTESFARQLMVPLDGQVGIVEMPDLNSYHTSTLAPMFPVLFGTSYMYGNKVATKDMARLLEHWTPDNPGSFAPGTVPAAGRRRRHMPALMFNQE